MGPQMDALLRQCVGPTHEQMPRPLRGHGYVADPLPYRLLEAQINQIFGLSKLRTDSGAKHTNRD